MKKELVVGKDYYSIFRAKGEGQMIYNGGISWTAKEGDKEMTMDSEYTTNEALKYINQPSYGTGEIRG